MTTTKLLCGKRSASNNKKRPYGFSPVWSLQCHRCDGKVGLPDRYGVNMSQNWDWQTISHILLLHVGIVRRQLRYCDLS